MCNVMVSYFKINQKFQRNERQSRSERADPRILKQAYQSMIRAIVFGQIRDGASRSEQIELKEMIRFEQSRVKSSGEKCGRQERSKNTTEGEKSCSKREEKIAVRRSERRFCLLFLNSSSLPRNRLGWYNLDGSDLGTVQVSNDALPISEPSRFGD